MPKTVRAVRIRLRLRFLYAIVVIDGIIGSLIVMCHALRDVTAQLSHARHLTSSPSREVLHQYEVFLHASHDGGKIGIGGGWIFDGG